MQDTFHTLLDTVTGWTDNTDIHAVHEEANHLIADELMGFEKSRPELFLSDIHPQQWEGMMILKKSKKYLMTYA